ncbi:MULTISPECIES: MerR family transcriptional regulator [Burkholderia]|jgi:DNA-binding transcriptional MerR regulator|uniref:MerR family transcriptional regulator n=1 Tax=Burkholderia cenocepacia TaxID=95486 RepID=A0A1V2W3P4_9BURK|nr:MULTISPECIES: MerR family transcriptional regulator [Burkholderia]MBR8250407.1 MerR family transcriptional regulator [Burkholderia cenocepacia]MBR8289820.1 MerR family transcriptional regulator [Burkholderia cenocepacia]MBR8494683.1 MerR family transcriptional regulator [Burkholderia cenocepacia]MCL4633813.1 MerR family transcriptional regulator [Burkholderia sp.]MDN7630668.1 MerR family transcriptional regulator [Burkholderia cenocepacia]
MKNPPTQPLLTIGKLAQLTGASVRSIRHYDEHGLLASVRADNGYRLFPDKAVTQVKQIQRMIATGFTLDDIHGFPDCMLLIDGARSCDQITDVQRERLEAIDRQIADLEKRRARLVKMLRDGAVPPLD